MVTIVIMESYHKGTKDSFTTSPCYLIVDLGSGSGVGVDAFIGPSVDITHLRPSMDVGHSREVIKNQIRKR